MIVKIGEESKQCVTRTDIKKENIWTQVTLELYKVYTIPKCFIHFQSDLSPNSRCWLCTVDNSGYTNKTYEKTALLRMKSGSITEN